MARIENHKYSIEEAFRECFYIVPDYQREYVWTDKEVHQLLEDIGEQIDAGTTREYFIGTVLVSPTDQKNHYEVIDGQQRLTTFFLLLCALKHLFQGEPQRQMISGADLDQLRGQRRRGAHQPEAGAALRKRGRSDGQAGGIGCRSAGRARRHSGFRHRQLRLAGKSGQRLQHAVPLPEGQLRRRAQAEEVLGLSGQQRGVHPDLHRRQQRAEDLRDHQRARRRPEPDGLAQEPAVHAGQASAVHPAQGRVEEDHQAAGEGEGKAAALPALLPDGQLRHQERARRCGGARGRNLRLVHRQGQRGAVRLRRQALRVRAQGDSQRRALPGLRQRAG
jgi:hypothetical protein